MASGQRASQKNNLGKGTSMRNGQPEIRSASVSDAILSDWSEKKVAEFGSVPLQLNHNLHQHALFADEALVRLIENADRADYQVNTMDVTTHDLSSRREGEIRDLSGHAVLEAVRNGHIWILLLHPQRSNPLYLDLLHQIFAEIAEKVPSFEPYLLNMAILISSPKVQVYYHCDIPGQMLWQIRGNKKVYIYPNREPFLNPASLERITLGEANEFGLPYDKSFDEHAVVYDLQPGQMLHWPINAPHRIVNADCVNVSFATEHFTRSIRRRFFVNYANGVLRRRQGWAKLSQKTTGLSYWAKLGLAAAYKLTGTQKKRKRIARVDFTVDPTAPNGVRPISSYTFVPGRKRKEEASRSSE
jgi:hypothetical protein